MNGYITVEMAKGHIQGKNTQIRTHVHTSICVAAAGNKTKESMDGCWCTLRTGVDFATKSKLVSTQQVIWIKRER